MEGLTSFGGFGFHRNEGWRAELKL